MLENKNYLITTNNWFYAPDGQQYRAVWGNVTLLQDDFLGIKTNEKSTNWYAKVGTEENFVIVAGCQIHYAVVCDEKPNTNPVISDMCFEGKWVKSERMGQIYVAE